MCVCFHLIHLRDTGRIKALHHSLVPDSMTPRDPTFTWALLDCGSPLSLLLSGDERGINIRRRDGKKIKGKGKQKEDGEGKRLV